jgi:hypothetical protein
MKHQRGGTILGLRSLGRGASEIPPGELQLYYDHYGIGYLSI